MKCKTNKIKVLHEEIERIETEWENKVKNQEQYFIDRVKEIEQQKDNDWKLVQHRNKTLVKNESKHSIEKTNDCNTINKSVGDQEKQTTANNESKDKQVTECGDIREITKQLEHYREAIWLLRGCKPCMNRMLGLRKKGYLK